VRQPGALVFVVLACLTWSIGVVDAFAFDTFGVFTTNQAGNLVVFAKAPWDNWPQARLAGLSLAGAAMGMILGTVMSRRLQASYRLSLLMPLLTGAVMLIVAAGLTTDGTRPAWMVPVMAAATGCIAGGWMVGGRTRMWLTANTGAYLGAVRAIVFPDEVPDGGGRRRLASTASRAAVAATLGFVSGIATYGVGAADWPHPVIIGLVPTVLAVILLARDRG
jgi:uncharacterized membrane protein YoaK (UPF0700 family)